MIELVNMASVTTPKIVESPAREWIEYGENNNYYDYLIERFNGSAVNNAIITGVGEMIYGQGLAATDANKHPLDYAKLKMIFKDEDLRKVCLDLKLLGQASFNIVWNKGKTEIKKATHIPIQNIRPEKAEDGKIKAYYYSDDWSQFRKDKYKPIRIEAFDGVRKSSDSQILVLQPYSPGFFYFTPVDYQGSLQWSEIDEEISNYHLTNIQNGFAPSMMLNFNNGTPTKEEQDAIERKITQKFTSTAGKKFVLSFNDNASSQTTIEQIPISDASEQYKFLSEECTKKILVGHRVTSPMLFGIKDKTGLGNNAEEIKVASQLFDNTVIRPKQNIILDAITRVLQVNSINLDIYFITLQPIEFLDDIEVVDKDTIEKETGVKMSSDKDKRPFLDDNKSQELLDELETYGEVNDDDEWELLSEEIVDTTNPAFHKEFEHFDRMPNSSDSRVGEKSKWGDKGLYKVRYAFTKTASQSAKNPSRLFCTQMIMMSDSGIEFRYEDIKRMGRAGVNGSFAPKGRSTYDLFMWKGGVNCYHGWMRRIYFRKQDAGKFLPNKGMENEKRVGNNPYVVQKGKESIAPIDTPNKGSLRR